MDEKNSKWNNPPLEYEYVMSRTENEQQNKLQYVEICNVNG